MEYGGFWEASMTFNDWALTTNVRAKAVLLAI